MTLADGAPESPPSPSSSAVVGGATTLRSGGGAAHVALALGAPGLASGAASVHALGVLVALLGGTGPAGGGAGAPRLGPQGHSRIARSIHNEAHSFIHSATAFALPYGDSALLCVAGAAADHEAGRLAVALAGLLRDAAALPAGDAELARAKAAYKLRIAGDVETAAGARDFIAAQLLLAPAAKPASLAATLRAVDAVTAPQLQALARAALAGRPALAAIGSGEALPRYEAIRDILAAGK